MKVLACTNNGSSTSNAFEQRFNEQFKRTKTMFKSLFNRPCMLKTKATAQVQLEFERCKNG